MAVSKIRVRPTKEHLIVLDGNGRRIEYKESGVEVIKTVHVTRRLKDGDLELIKARKVEKKKGDTK